MEKKNKKSYIFILVLIIFLILAVIMPEKYDNAENNQNNIRVFVIDSGINEEFINNRHLYGFKEPEHGSIVADIILNDFPRAKLDFYKITDNDPLGEFTAVLNTISDFYDRNPGERIVVNISLSISSFHHEHEKLIKELYEKGIVIIAAAGNENSEKKIYPAGYDEVIAVASASMRGKSSESNYGSHVDISASGKADIRYNILFPGLKVSRRLKAAGTSFAAPRVTALMLKILYLKPELTVKEAEKIILNNTLPINDRFYEQGKLGEGLISANRVFMDMGFKYWLKANQKLLVLIIISAILLYYFWKRVRLLGIFYVLIIIIIIYPIYMYFRYLILRQPYTVHLLIFLLLGMFLFFIIKQILINNKKDKIILDLNKFIENKRIDAEKLLIYLIDKDIIDSREHYKLAIKFIENKDRLIIPELLKKLKNNTRDDIKEIAVKLLIDIDSNLKLKYLFSMLNRGNFDRLAVMEVLENMGKLDKKEDRINELNLKVIKRLEEIMEDHKLNMWLRYQALRTLVQIHPEKDKVHLILEKYFDDKQQLVSMEAKALLTDYKKKL